MNTFLSHHDPNYVPILTLNKLTTDTETNKTPFYTLRTLNFIIWNDTSLQFGTLLDDTREVGPPLFSLLGRPNQYSKLLYKTHLSFYHEYLRKVVVIVYDP